MGYLWGKAGGSNSSPQQADGVSLPDWMKIEYDKEADTAYIYLKYPINKGEAEKQVKVDEQIILDFDKNNKLLGIEILDASKKLVTLPN